MGGGPPSAGILTLAGPRLLGVVLGIGRAPATAAAAALDGAVSRGVSVGRPIHTTPHHSRSEKTVQNAELFPCDARFQILAGCRILNMLDDLGLHANRSDEKSAQRINRNMSIRN